MRSKRILVIGVESFYGQEVLRGLHGYCRAHGRWEYQFAGDGSPESVKLARMDIGRWNPDGIIARIHSGRVERLVRNSRLPAVNVSGARKSAVPGVIPDYAAAGRMAALHFLENGLRHFAFFGDHQKGRAHSEGLRGFWEELARRGFTCAVLTNLPERAISTAHRRMTDRWIKSLPKPVGVLCADPVFAMSFARSCRRLEVLVPEQVAVVVMGNQEIICQACTPPLSSVDTDIARVGYEAARVLDRMLRGGKVPAKAILTPPRGVVVRQSSDMVALDDAEVAGAVRYLREHAGEGMGVKQLVQRCGISKRSLEMRFKKSIGRTLGAEVRRIRTERACDLLRDSDLLIPKVAWRAGFGNSKRFAESFRREMGMTPMEYRRKSRGGMRRDEGRRE